jgi:pimeloyl-ACP methyl ester carboxylesterase
MASSFCRVVVGALAWTWLSGCAGQIQAEHEEKQVELQSSALKLRVACNDNFKAVYKRPGGNQGGALGDIVRCNKGGRVGTSEIAEELDWRGFAGVSPQKAVKLFRISYRTQRLAGQADLGTALVALPAKKDVAASVAAEEDDDDEDKNRDGMRLPLVVFAHGTSPYGTACAPSKLDPLQCSRTGEGDTELLTIMALASQGYPVISPDYAGYVEESRAPGYMLSEDEAHSVLDATRAMSKLRQKAVDKVVLLGHSQGGHAVLSAQALAKKYGHAGTLVGVVAMAPFWAPARTFGWLAGAAEGEDAHVRSFVIEYFYTHAEVLDGAGQGQLLFQPAKRAALANYINQCSFSEALCSFINPVPPELGSAAEFFQPDLYAAVTACGVDTAACNASPLAKTWHRRFKADRPKLDRAGAPTLMWHGALDTVVPMAFGTCAYEKIANDLSGNPAAKFTFCGDKYANHDQILSFDLSWVMSWINARALGTPEPAACLDYPTFAAEVQSEFGLDIACPAPPSPVNAD